MQISLLCNVKHLDHRPLVKAVHAVAVGGHLEDQDNLLKGIVIWFIRKEGIEPIKFFFLKFSFQTHLF